MRKGFLAVWRLHRITAPKTYAGDIKAFANSRSLRETYFHFANA